MGIYVYTVTCRASLHFSLAMYILRPFRVLSAELITFYTGNSASHILTFTWF